MKLTCEDELRGFRFGAEDRYDGCRWSVIPPMNLSIRLSHGVSMFKVLFSAMQVMAILNNAICMNIGRASILSKCNSRHLSSRMLRRSRISGFKTLNQHLEATDLYKRSLRLYEVGLSRRVPSFSSRYPPLPNLVVTLNSQQFFYTHWTRHP